MDIKVKILNKITKDEFGKRIKTHQKELYRFAFSILKSEADAQNALCTAIVFAFEHRGSLRNPENFKSWMMQIVATESKHLLKQKGKFSGIQDIEIYQNVPVKTSKTSNHNIHDLWDDVMQLEDELRPIAVLFYYENYSTREISKVMRMPEGMVKSRLSGAREKLKLSVT